MASISTDNLPDLKHCARNDHMVRSRKPQKPPLQISLLLDGPGLLLGFHSSFTGSTVGISSRRGLGGSLEDVARYSSLVVKE